MGEHIEVWRLETLDGDGVFSAGLAYIMRDSLPEEQNPNRHPNPMEDIPGFRDDPLYMKSWRCGCTDKVQLMEWFPAEGMMAVADDTRVAVYLVPDECVRRGSKQVVYDTKYATLLRTLTPDELCRQAQPN